MCGLKADKERDDGDDKRRPETVLISPHQDAECHKAADMSLRQPTSTLDRYEPRIPRDLPLDTLPKNAVLPAQPIDVRLSHTSPVWTLEIPVKHAVYGGSGNKASPATLKSHQLILIGLFVHFSVRSTPACLWDQNFTSMQS